MRPNGLERPATPIFVDAVEELASLTPDPVRTSLGTLALRVALLPFACGGSISAAAAFVKGTVRQRTSRKRPAGAAKRRPVRTPAS